MEALSGGPDGAVDDDLALVAPWGFEPAGITIPIQLWQGGQDLMVPPSHGRWLSQHLPQADFQLLPEEVHLTLLAERGPQIHDWLLTHF